MATSKSQKAVLAEADWFAKQWPKLFGPENGSCHIWRFIDFPKFVWLISNSKLFMPSVGLLRKADPFECTVPKALVDEMVKIIRDIANDPSLSPHPAWQHYTDEKLFVSYVEDVARLACVTCWYQEGFPSDAMWRLYGNSNNSVAIRSTFDRLRRCLPTDTKLALVTYSDFASDVWEYHPLSLLFHKRLDFAHEKEVRGVVLPTTSLKKEFKDHGSPQGFAAPVDLKELVEEVHINPLADGWFEEVVKWSLEVAGLGAVPLIKSDLVPYMAFPKMDDELIGGKAEN